MSIQQDLNLTKVINARGTFTPLGVSRSSKAVGMATAQALSNYYVMDELQYAASDALASFSGAQAGAITHCTASSITLSVAATMTGTNQDKVALLPNSQGMPNKVVISVGHCVNYGHPIIQAIRLAGAEPVFAGTETLCTLDDIEQLIKKPEVCCLLLVSSKLIQNLQIEMSQAVAMAHKFKTPVIIDGAAQDFRARELVSTQADLVLFSAQKYLASPTAGLVVGQQGLIDAVRAQEKGIGRGMKATKESILGVLAAIQERENLNITEWQSAQDTKVSDFVDRANTVFGVQAKAVSDSTGLPFSRVLLTIDSEKTSLDAKALAAQFKAGTPSIWVMDGAAEKGELELELVQVSNSEINTILAMLSELLKKTARSV